MAQGIRESWASGVPRSPAGGGWPVTAGWKRTVAAAGGGLQLLWRIRLGWLTGHGLLVLTHVGRHTVAFAPSSTDAASAAEEM